MNSTLHDEILARVLADTNLPAVAQNLIDAACQGPAALARELDRPTSTTPVTPPTPTHAPPVSAPLYLASLDVRSFRGIATTARLTIQPGPGLTLVVGRNGSGKSSFAEAFEALLTGTSTRWEGRAQAWKQGWKNLHGSSSPRIVAKLVATADRHIEVCRDWAADAELDASTVTTTPPTETLADPRAAISTYRPFLSYADLGTLLAGEPSRLFDELNGLLGLDGLNDAIKLLTAERKRLDDDATAHKREREAIVAQLAAIDHPDARACHEALEVTRPRARRVARARRRGRRRQRRRSTAPHRSARPSRSGRGLHRGSCTPRGDRPRRRTRDASGRARRRPRELARARARVPRDPRWRLSCLRRRAVGLVDVRADRTATDVAEAIRRAPRSHERCDAGEATRARPHPDRARATARHGAPGPR